MDCLSQGHPHWLVLEPTPVGGLAGLGRGLPLLQALHRVQATSAGDAEAWVSAHLLCWAH